MQVEGDAEIDRETERVGAVLNREHHPFVAHDGSQAAGLTGFLGNLLEIGSGDRNNALTGGDGSHRKIKNALGELVALVLLIAGEITELTQGAADAEDGVLGEAGELDQLGEGAALVGLADVFHDDEGTLQVRDGVVGFGWHFVDGGCRLAVGLQGSLHGKVARDQEPCHEIKRGADKDHQQSADARKQGVEAALHKTLLLGVGHEKKHFFRRE